MISSSEMFRGSIKTIKLGIMLTINPASRSGEACLIASMFDFPVSKDTFYSKASARSPSQFSQGITTFGHKICTNQDFTVILRVFFVFVGYNRNRYPRTLTRFHEMPFSRPRFLKPLPDNQTWESH